MYVDNAKEITLHKINANFPKVSFTYIKLTRKVRKQCAPTFILREFAAIKTSQHTYLKWGTKKTAFPVISNHPRGNGSIARPVERYVDLNS